MRLLSSRRGMLAVPIVAMMAAFAGCGGSSDSGGTGDKFSVMLASTPTGLDAPLFYGKAKGVFEKHGIDLDIQQGKGSQVAYDTAASGRVQAAVTVYSASVLNAAKGGDLVSFASVYQVDPSGVIVGKSTGITSVADLEGKTLLVASGSATRAMLPLMLKDADVDVDSVELKDVQLSSLYAAYSAGQGDGMVTVIPNSLPLIQDKRPSTVLSFQDNGILDPGYSLVAQPSALTKDKDLYVRFVAALAEAEAATTKAPDKAVEAVVKEAPELSADVVKGQMEAAEPFRCWPDSPAGSDALQQPQKLWTSSVSLFERADLIKKGSVDPTKIFSNDIVDAAAKDSKGGLTCK